MADKEFEQKMETMRVNLGKKLKSWDRPIWGYEKAPEPERKEGERWTDSDGRKWIVKGGIKQTISKMEKFRKPWFCPSCSKAMNHRFDDKFLALYNKCYNCTIEWHTKMKLNGTWNEFEQTTLRENELSYLKDKISGLKDYVRTFKIPQVHFSNGGWEELATIGHFKKLFDDIKDEIELCEKRISQIEEEKLKKENTDDNNNIK